MILYHYENTHDNIRELKNLNLLTRATYIVLYMGDFFKIIGENIKRGGCLASRP